MEQETSFEKWIIRQNDSSVKVDWSRTNNDRGSKKCPKKNLKINKIPGTDHIPAKLSKQIHRQILGTTTDG